MTRPVHPAGTRRPGLFTTLMLACAALTASCADTAYLLGSASGHLQLLQAARPVDDWLAEDNTPPALKERLRMAQDIRRFAVGTLHLPDNASYQRYAQLPRRAVVWNVVAAPAYSLTLSTWCFPLVGCVGYRGYFDEQEAKQEADAMRARGLEVTVYGVPAYSTLGWTNLLGGDPLLSTFIQYPQGELARMIFHEMAHQVVYVKDDTAFNESFATAVERLGSTAWLANHAKAGAQTEYSDFDARRRAFRTLTTKTQQQLKAVYTQGSSDAAAVEVKKQAVYAEFRQSYAELKQGWGGSTGYDTWVADANNAAFGALAAYDDWVAAFEVLFARHPGDWRSFYGAVHELAELPRAQRTQELQQLLAHNRQTVAAQ